MKKNIETKSSKGKTVLALALCAVVAVTAIVAVQVTNEKEREREDFYAQQQEESIKLAENEVTQGENLVQAETDSIDSIGDAALVEAQTTTKMSNQINTADETIGNFAEITTMAELEQSTNEEEINSAQQVDVSAYSLSFMKESKMDWPVQGDVISSFNMDSTVYFPTLDQYKYNPAMLIQSDVNTPVLATTDGVVKEISSNEEIGEYVLMALGNEYELLYGQLKAIEVTEGQMVQKGQVIGYVSEPTKYYSVEGNHLYLKMTENDSPVDPLDYME